MIVESDFYSVFLCASFQDNQIRRQTYSHYGSQLRDWSSAP